MGLGFYIKDYNCNARWSYSGFHAFRVKIAKCLNVDLKITPEFKWVEQNWSEWDPDWLLFLTHSDCDGKLTASQCGRIGSKLKNVLNQWMIKDYDYENGIILVEAMDHCKKENKTMRFV